MEVEDYFLLAFVFLIVFLGTAWIFMRDISGLEISGWYYPPGSNFPLKITLFVEDAIVSFIRQVSVSLTIGFAIAGAIKYIIRKVKRK
jgi:hypothetical protein